MDEIYTPDVVCVRWPEPDDRAVFVVQASALFVSLRQLQPLFAPEPFNLLVIDRPAFNAQQLRDLAIAVAAELLCKSDQRQP